MKTATLLLAAAAAAVAHASEGQAPGPDTKYNCAKPNANYCMGGDIILRCDANSIGTPGRCSDNVAGYPPAGGVAECHQSSKEAGDAACEKNCVVYAAQSSFTLPASQCTPSASASGYGASTTTSAGYGGSSPSSAVYTSTVYSTSSAGYGYSSSSPAGYGGSSSSSVYSSPSGYATPSSSSVYVSSSPVSSGYGGGSTSVSVSAMTTITPGGPIVNVTSTASATPSTYPGGVVGSNTTTTIVVPPSSSNLPVGPTTTGSSPGTVPTGAASVNQAAAGLLAAVGFVAALLA